MTDDAADDVQRYVLAVEDFRTPDGRRILPGALQLPQESKPVLMRDRDHSPTGYKIFGEMLDFQRDERGVITVACDPPLPEKHQLAVSLGMVDFDESNEEELVITTAEPLAAMSTTDPWLWEGYDSAG